MHITRWQSGPIKTQLWWKLVYSAKQKSFFFTKTTFSGYVVVDASVDCLVPPRALFSSSVILWIYNPQLFLVYSCWCMWGLWSPVTDYSSPASIVYFLLDIPSWLCRLLRLHVSIITIFIDFLIVFLKFVLVIW